MRLLFRVDCSVSIGAGHLMRTLCLANLAARYGITSHFLCKDLPGFDTTLITQQHHEMTLLPSDITWRQFYRLLLTLGQFDWLIVDHYQLDQRWERAVGALLPQQLIIDDLANRDHWATQLLDMSLIRQARDYHSSHWLREPLLGPSFALLRPEFASLRPQAVIKRRATDMVNHLLISLGAMDADNHLTRLINALDSLPLAPLTIDIALSRHAPHLMALKKAIASSRHAITLHLDSDQMAQLMLNADLAIGAGGISCWERATLALPTLLFILADNQRGNSQQLSHINAASYLGDLRELDDKTLAKQLIRHWPTATTLRLMANNCAKLCDGDGAIKVLSHLTRQDLPTQLAAITQDDAQWMWQWQQDESTRYYSRHHSAPTLSEHQTWLTAALNEPHRWLFKLISNNQPCAVIRLDEASLERPVNEVSLYVNPRRYHQGHGKQALTLLRQLFPTIRLHAYIHPDNIASLTLFQQFGFQPMADDNWFYHPPLEINDDALYY